jgi:4-hydroxybenzoate polyprenyltransferase
MTVSPPPPGYVRAAGGLAVVLGLTVTFWIGSVWPNWRPAGLLTAMGGVGLIAGVRWAWPTILLVAAAVFFVAFVFLTDAPEDPIHLWHWVGWVLVVVGIAMVASAFTPSTWRWLRGRTITRA